MKSSPSRWQDLAFWSGLALLVLLFVAWQFQHLGGFRWDWDEGAYALTARQVAAGHRLYADIFSMAPPLFIESLDVAFRVAGETIPVGRAVIVLYSALGLLGVGLLAREMRGRVAGLAAVVALSIAPHFYVLSRTIIADMPSMGLACLALWLSLRYGRTGRRWWLMACGLTLSLGMLIKLTAGLVAPVIVVTVLLHDWPAAWQEPHRFRALLRRVGSSALALVGPFLAPIVLCLAVYPWRPMMEQVVLLLWSQQNAFVPDPPANMSLIEKYLLVDNRNIALNRGLTVLALAGGLWLLAPSPQVVGGDRSRKDALVWWLWLLITLAVLSTYAPLWPHLLSPILFPLAVGAGVAVGELYRRSREVRATGWTMGQATVIALLILVVAIYLYDWPAIVSENRRRGEAPGGHEAEAILRLIQEKVGPEQYLITDEPLLAFVANRSAPPDLSDSSIVRIASGKLITSDLIRETEDHSASAVVLWQDKRFVTYLPDYIQWVEQRYQRIYENDKGGRLYVRSAH